VFTNFIYFIVVLLIYATYQPADSTNFSTGDGLILFSGGLVFFFFISRLAFQRVAKHVGIVSSRILDQRFSATQLRLSILAVFLYGADIYLLNLPDFISKIPFLGNIPSFQAVLCILLFIGYLSIVWASSHDTYRLLYPSSLGKRAYVQSNISFSVPVLIPWFVLSVVNDLLYALPFEAVKRTLSSPLGELLYIVVFLSAISIIGPAMIQKFWRCAPLPPGASRSRIENICQQLGIQYHEIVEWPVFGGLMITAGVMGLVKRFRYILVTRGLLANLNAEELESVIAHEIGHVKKNHLLFYLFFFTGYILISYAAFDIIVYLTLYSKPVFFVLSAIGYSQASMAPVLLSAIMIVFFLIYFRYIFGYFMRNFERQADAFAFSSVGTAQPLVSTFRKISFASGQSPDKPNWHHFSIGQRIDFLERCEHDSRLPSLQDRKVSRSITVFFIAILIIGAIGYQLNFGSGGEKLNAHFLEEIIHSEIENNPNDSELFANLGDLYYIRNDYANTIDAYEHAIAIDPNMPHVLNNLGWLYATCEVEEFRDPERALFLSKKSVALLPTAENLDTLAESFFINGKYEEAVAAETKALELCTDNRSDYLEQLEKFRRAVEK
jgi:Zn-dependent protease with chaperone function